jgi:hypothetical protein
MSGVMPKDESRRAEKRLFCHPHNVDDGEEMRDLSSAGFGGASRRIDLKCSNIHALINQKYLERRRGSERLQADFVFLPSLKDPLLLRRTRNTRQRRQPRQRGMLPDLRRGRELRLLVHTPQADHDRRRILRRGPVQRRAATGQNTCARRLPLSATLTYDFTAPRSTNVSIGAATTARKGAPDNT